MYTTHHCQQLGIIPNSQNWTPKHLHVLIFPTIAERSNIYTELFNFWLVVNIFFLYPEPSVLVAFNVIGRGTLFDPRAFVTCLLGVEGGLIYQKVIFFPKGEKEHRLFLSVKCSEIQFWIVEWGYIIFLRNLTVPRNRRFLLLRQFYPFIPFRCRMLSPHL